MLATLGWVCDGVGIMEEEGGNAGRLVGMGAAGGHGGWGGAGAMPSISPTCSGTAVEPSSARSPTAGAVHWCFRLRIVRAGGAGWPWFAMNGEVSVLVQTGWGGARLGGMTCLWLCRTWVVNHRLLQLVWLPPFVLGSPCPMFSASPCSCCKNTFGVLWV